MGKSVRLDHHCDSYRLWEDDRRIRIRLFGKIWPIWCDSLWLLPSLSLISWWSANPSAGGECFELCPSLRFFSTNFSLNLSILKEIPYLSIIYRDNHRFPPSKFASISSLSQIVINPDWICQRLSLFRRPESSRICFSMFCPAWIENRINRPRNLKWIQSERSIRSCYWYLESTRKWRSRISSFPICNYLRTFHFPTFWKIEFDITFTRTFGLFWKLWIYRVFHPTMSISVQLWIGTGSSTSARRGAWMETDGWNQKSAKRVCKLPDFLFEAIGR
jgi:hypothetical protein